MEDSQVCDSSPFHAASMALGAALHPPLVMKRVGKGKAGVQPDISWLTASYEQGWLSRKNILPRKNKFPSVKAKRVLLITPSALWLQICHSSTRLGQIGLHQPSGIPAATPGPGHSCSLGERIGP